MSLFNKYKKIKNQCPICSVERPFFPVIETRDFSVVKCCKCGLVSTFQDSTANKVEYDENYFENVNNYLNRSEEFRNIFGKFFKMTEKYLPPKGKLLDIGCGVGLLLDVARQKGFSVSGIELSDYAAEIARENFKLNVKIGTLLNTGFEDQTFDIVIMNHVMEHLPNPISELEEIKRILKKGGIILVGVPNFGSIFRVLLRSKWPSLLPEQHIWHFTSSTLQKMLLSAGFSIENIVMFDNHVYGRKLRAPFRFAIKLLSKASLVFNRADSMIAIGRKVT